MERQDLQDALQLLARSLSENLRYLEDAGLDEIYRTSPHDLAAATSPENLTQRTPPNQRQTPPSPSQDTRLVKAQETTAESTPLQSNATDLNAEPVNDPPINPQQAKETLLKTEHSQNTNPAKTTALSADEIDGPGLMRSPFKDAMQAPAELKPAKEHMTLNQLQLHSGNAKERLSLLEKEVIGECERCKLQHSRTQLVFGTGNPDADLVFIGAGPNAEEDRQGIPQVGNAGALLDKMILAMKMRRDDVYICNLVKCRPPNHRSPDPDEAQACEPFLRAQLNLLKPKVIVTLGRAAAEILLRKRAPLNEMHGQWFEYQGIKVLPSFTPEQLLQNPQLKRPAWQDLQKVMAFLDENADRP